MKKLFGFAFAAALCAALVLLSCSNSSDSGSSGGGSEKIHSIAASYAPSNSWGNGWNLGNTLDAHVGEFSDKVNKGLSTETSWGAPETTQAMIKAIAAAGFKTIRIPVSWHNHITDTDGHKIDSAWLARVKTVVDWSLDAGMNVIINIHHDNLTEAQMATTYGFCVPEAGGANYASLKTNSQTYITDIWKQVATHFKDYNDKLIFEILNEPRAVGKDYEWGADTNEKKDKVSAANVIIKEYEKAALDIIRASGGNNATRYLMVPPYAASPSLMDGWSLPTDSASNKLIVSVHAYTPYDFCMGKDNTFTAAHKSNIEDWLFATLNTQFVSKNIPVIIGETSASDKNNYAERVKWAKCFFAAAKAKGISCILWDNMKIYPEGDNIAERHGYFNRNNLSWY
ncbi:MAG: glycoside hydrolase family 5 protein [Treponema sp.]|nr:glycoside hydrolase family 5 protein [Treponema sp.]